MKRLGAIFMLVMVLSACFMWRPSKAENPLSAIPQEELDHPEFTVLPCGDGFLFGYKLKETLSVQQIAYMAAVHVAVGDTSDIDFKGKVLILAFIEPNEAASLTVDFRQNVVELREDFPKDKYRTRIWEGDPRGVLMYLSHGDIGSPKITKGNRSNEIIPPSLPCGPRQEI